MLGLIQFFGGIILIIFGALGLFTPLIPGIILIISGISMIFHVTLRTIFSIFRQNLLF